LGVGVDDGAHGRGEVVERRLGLDEAEPLGAAGGVVDADEERARRAAILEPSVLAAVDLDELAEAVAPVARLVGLAQPLAAGGPQAGGAPRLRRPSSG
jgi:hypothetical protein